jgi:outer membrane protein OmpA-like peptidoglycan-associated protein
LLWADAVVSGRTVEMHGVAPDEAAKTEALNVVSRVFGVAQVVDKLTVSGTTELAHVSGTVPVKKVLAKSQKPTGPYALTIEKDGDDVKLTGSVPDEASKDVLVRLATTHYGANHVKVVSLTIDAAAPAGWRTAAGAVLMHITNLETASVMLSNTEVMVSGTVQDQQFADQMEAAVQNVLPKNYKAAFAVAVVTPTTPPAAVADVEPAAGTATVAQDCAALSKLAKERLHFQFDRAELTPSHTVVIERVADVVKQCTTEKVLVAGFTDTTGSALYNQWLSQQRAEAGLRGLMKAGVAKEQLRAQGFGASQPVATNATRAGRAANRRVEFRAGAAATAAVQQPAAAKAKAAPKAVVKTTAKTHEKSLAERAAAEAVSLTTMVSKTVVSATTAVSNGIPKPWWARAGFVPSATKPVTPTAAPEVKWLGDQN